MGKIKELLEAGIDIGAASDQLVNNDEVTKEDLMDVAGLSDKQAAKLLKSWFNLSPAERDKLGFNRSKIGSWVKGKLK